MEKSWGLEVEEFKIVKIHLILQDIALIHRALYGAVPRVMSIAGTVPVCFCYGRMVYWME